MAPPEDDASTLKGTPRAPHAVDQDRAADPHDAEDRTVQQLPELDHGEDPEDSITATAPRVGADLAALFVAGTVRTGSFDAAMLGDETEVGPRRGIDLPEVPDSFRASAAHAPRPAAGVPASGGDSLDGSPKPQGVDGVDTPPTRPSAADVRAPPGIDKDDGYANDGDSDESVTTRGRPVEPYADESVTKKDNGILSLILSARETKGPAGDARARDATLDDGTGGTTEKLRKGGESTAESKAAVPERVVASMGDQYDEPPENRTAVMVNAPLKQILAALVAPHPLPPAGMPSGTGPAPPAEASGSALRVARAEAPADHASLSVPGPVAARQSGLDHTAAAERDGEEAVFDPHASPSAPRPQTQPSLHDADRVEGPRYGLLVGTVALISFLVPVTLFVALRERSEPLTAGVPAQPVSELKAHDAPRGKLDKKTASAGSTASAASASAASAASAGREPPRPAPRR